MKKPIPNDATHRLESDASTAVRKVLASHPSLACWRNNVGSPDGRYQYGLGKGTSDFIAILAPSGRFLALEVKSATGKQTKDQAQFAAAIRAMGGFACVVRNAHETIEAIKRAQEGLSE